MISLQPLKIPRGSRSDWAVQEYALIDYVEGTVNELFNAREGNTSLVANLNERYATKTYVQLAILNPDIEEVMAADLGVAPSDSTKIGYSLQIDSAGTGLIYSNIYSLASGTIAEPSLAFKQDGHDSGIYVSTLSTIEIMHFKILGGDAFTVSVDSLGGAATLAIGDVSLRSDGNITWKNGTFEVINGIKITCVGAGPAFRSSFADIEMVQVSITGTGASATQIAEAIVSSKLTIPDAVDASDATSYGQLLNEKTERENADDFLQDELDTESFTRAAADDVLQDNIDAEEAARIAVDDALQDNIDAEAAARIAADDNLNNIKAAKNGSATEVFSVAPATANEHAVRKDQLNFFIPPGIILAYGGSTPPSGWLEVNGQSTTGYPALTAIYGANLPDLRGEFIRGWDNSRGIDTSRAVLSTQLDSIENITGTFSKSDGGTAEVTGAFAANGNIVGNLLDATVVTNVPAITFDASRVVRTSSETRPRNIALMYIVKT